MFKMLSGRSEVSFIGGCADSIERHITLDRANIDENPPDDAHKNTEDT